MIAIIETGGKQYKVTEGGRVKVAKLKDDAGKAVKFNVVFIGDDDKVALGSGQVEGKIIAHGRSKKVTGIRHKAKKRELTRYGHRQDYTEIEITKISA